MDEDQIENVDWTDAKGDAVYTAIEPGHSHLLGGVLATTGYISPARDYLISSALDSLILEAFQEKRGYDFCCRLTNELKLKSPDAKTKALSNIFSDDVLNSYKDLDNDELFNFLALTI